MMQGTPEQQLIFLNTHWGSRYTFSAPDSRGGKWVAQATFGEHDDLQEDSAGELLLAVRRHYEANKSAPG
jgi:hypothetical protein